MLSSCCAASGRLEPLPLDAIGGDFVEGTGFADGSCGSGMVEENGAVRRLLDGIGVLVGLTATDGVGGG